MAKASGRRPSAGYWVISALLALWSGLGVAVFIWLTLIAADPDLRADAVAAGRIAEDYAAYVAAIPAWGMMVAGIEFFSRLAAAIGLLLRRGFAVPLFAVSFAGVLLGKFRGFVLFDAAGAMTAPQIALETLMVAVSAFALWFAWRMRGREVLTP